MTEIPLFPLPLVFFPGGRLPLQIFETRYLDMIRRCMKSASGFGVIQIIEGHQILSGSPAGIGQPTVATCGTLGQIVDFDQHPNGTLAVTVQGGDKFIVMDLQETADRVLLAQVEILPEEPDTPLPHEFEQLAELLESMSQHEAIQRLGLDIDYDSARDVSWRLAEMLPSDLESRQRLLELQSPLKRLTEIEVLIEKLQADQL